MPARHRPGPRRSSPAGSTSHHDLRFDEPQRTHHLRRHQANRFPKALVIVLAILIIVVLVAVVLDLDGAFSPAPTNSNGGIVLAKGGSRWYLAPMGYQVVSFTTSTNGTLSGGFQVVEVDMGVNVLLMNETQYDNFSLNGSSLFGLNATGVTHFGGMNNWTVAPPGSYFLLADNPASTQVTIDWETDVVFLPETSGS